MISIILLIIMGRFFYKLAEEYNKSKWGYAILGIVTYYGTSIIYGITYVLIYFMANPNAHEDDISETFLNLTGIPIGIGGAYLLYYFLERNWKRSKKEEVESINIDDIGKS